MPPKSLIVTITLLFLVAYVYTAVRLYKIIPANLILRIILLSLFVIGMAGIILFFSHGEKIPTILASGIYRFSTSWLIVFLYLLISILLIDLFKLVNSIFHFFSKEIIVLYFNNNLTSTVIVFGSVTLLLLFGNFQYHNKKRQHINIKSENIDKPLRIVGISDLHIGYTISGREVEKWVNLINSEKPDIVIIAGDIVDNHIRPIIEGSIESVLSKIDAPMGVYACSGNHDLMFAIKEDICLYKRSKITLLRDSIVNINGITIIARDDHSNSNRKTLSDIMEKVDDSSFKILLEHQPLDLEEAVKNNIDFQFSGHTHRGQVFPISLITDALFELSHGYLKKDNTHYYVSTGIGIWGGKFRIGTRSEYLVLDLNPS